MSEKYHRKSLFKVQRNAKWSLEKVWVGNIHTCRQRQNWKWLCVCRTRWIYHKLPCKFYRCHFNIFSWWSRLEIPLWSLNVLNWWGLKSKKHADRVTHSNYKQQNIKCPTAGLFKSQLIRSSFRSIDKCIICSQFNFVFNYYAIARISYLKTATPKNIPRSHLHYYVLL